MNTSKIAVITDTGTDVPAEFIEKHGNIFVIPLVIQYSYGTFFDGVDITADKVYADLSKEIPKTSLPSGEVISKTIEKVISAGYEKVFAVTLSSGLSGTHNMLRIISESFPELDFRFIDTKNIGIGAGFTVIKAVELIEEGLSADEIESELLKGIKRTKVFFSVDTLEYLAHGGRINKVTARLGSALGICPVISCNDDGIYYTVSKPRGRSNSIAHMIKLASDFASGQKYRLAIAVGQLSEEAALVREKIAKLIDNAEVFIDSRISPALGAHTGPGLIGIGVQLV